MGECHGVVSVSHISQNFALVNAGIAVELNYAHASRMNQTIPWELFEGPRLVMIATWCASIVVPTKSCPFMLSCMAVVAMFVKIASTRSATNAVNV